MRTTTVTRNGVTDAAYVCDSGYGTKTYRLGFPISNVGFYVYVTNASDLDDALETIGADVWRPHARLCRILRADEAYAETIAEHGEDIDGEYFPVNGGEHYIDMPSTVDIVAHVGD